MAFLFLVEVPCEKEDILKLNQARVPDVKLISKDVSAIPEENNTAEGQYILDSEPEKAVSDNQSTVGSSIIVDATEEQLPPVIDKVEVRKSSIDTESTTGQVTDNDNVLKHDADNVAEDKSETRNTSADPTAIQNSETVKTGAETESADWDFGDEKKPKETESIEWDFGDEGDKNKQVTKESGGVDTEEIEECKTDVQPIDVDGEAVCTESNVRDTDHVVPTQATDVGVKTQDTVESAGSCNTQTDEVACASDESPKKEFDVQKIDEPPTRLKSETSSGLLTPFVTTEEKTLLEYVLKALEDLSVENVSSQPMDNGRLAQISFIQEDSRRCEEILNKLKGVGVGGLVGTSLSVFPASVHESYLGSEVTSTDVELETSEEELQKESQFKKSIKSRLVVAQVVASVRSNAQFTFDYLLLIILASMIAAVGLVENSPVVLVASMLISPLMGPILAGTFGQVIKMNELRNLGVKSELLGLLICLVVGFLCGLVTGGIGIHGTSVFSGDEWPTTEMKSRGMLRSLVIGVLIAVPSGAGVALSVLGGNAGSLVGVAISASLLPPAVNAGMLWAYALLAGIWPPEFESAMLDSAGMADVTNITTVNTTTTTMAPNMSLTSPVSGSCLPLVDNAYSPVYSCNLAYDAVLLAVISLLLTLLNISCIFVMGVIVLKIKEVAPHTADSTSTLDNFWQEDVKVARSYYQTTKGGTSQSLGQRFVAEWQKMKHGQSAAEQTDDQLEEPVNTINLVNYIKKVENSWLSRHLWSRLSPASPSQQVSSSLDSEYNRAALLITEKISHNPAVYLNERPVATRSRKLENAYHTIHSVADSSVRPRLNSLRERFRKTASMHIESDVLNELDENFTDSPRKSRSGFGFKLNLSNNMLAKKRKLKTVQFDEAMEEENLV